MKADTGHADLRRQKQAASEVEGMRQQKHAQACSNRQEVLVTAQCTFPKAVAPHLCQFCCTGSKAERRGWMSSGSGSL